MGQTDFRADCPHCKKSFRYDFDEVKDGILHCFSCKKVIRDKLKDSIKATEWVIRKNQKRIDKIMDGESFKEFLNLHLDNAKERKELKRLKKRLKERDKK